MIVTTEGRRPGLLSRMSHWTLLRILSYLVATLVPVVAFEWVIHFVIPAAPSPFHTPSRLAANLVGPVLALGMYRWLVRRIENRPATELDIGHGGMPLLAGATVGAALIGATYLALWGLGIARFEAGDGPDGLLPGFVIAVCAAVTEELLVRAVVFRLLEAAGGTTVAMAMSSALFGLAHAFNPGATLLSSVEIAIEAGILLALAFALTRNLWFAVGIHLGWNFTEGTIFGGAVSGGNAAHSLVKAALSGPDYLTGGTFGPEASVAALGICLAAAAVLGIMVVRRGEWRPMTRFRFSLP